MGKYIFYLLPLLYNTCWSQLNAVVIEVYNSEDKIKSYIVTTMIDDSINVSLQINDRSVLSFGKLGEMGFNFDGHNFSNWEISSDNSHNLVSKDGIVFTYETKESDTLFILDKNLVIYFNGDLKEYCYINQNNLVDSIKTVAHYNDGTEYVWSTDYYSYDFFERNVIVNHRCQQAFNEPYRSRLVYINDETIENNRKSNFQFWPIQLAVYKPIRDYYSLE